MVEWHHQLNGHELEQALGIGDGQGSLQQRVRYDWVTVLNSTENTKRQNKVSGDK